MQITIIIDVEPPDNAGFDVAAVLVGHTIQRITDGAFHDVRQGLAKSVTARLIDAREPFVTLAGDARRG